MGTVPADDDPRAGLFPRLIDDWTDPPRALFLVTADADRAQADLEPMLGADWHPAGDDATLSASCRRIRLGRGELLLAQPNGDGYAAAAWRPSERVRWRWRSTGRALAAGRCAPTR